MKVYALVSLAAILAACAHDKKQIVNAAWVIRDPLQVSLSVGAFADTSFASFGFYDKEGFFEHQYGGPDVGYFAYAFKTPAQGLKEVTVTARLSAESGSIGKPEETSDVTLSIDEVVLGTQTVRPDDSKGQVYTWKSQDPSLLSRLAAGGSHLLKLEVEEKAASRHGLCVYGESIDGKEPGTPPTISLTPL